MLDDADVDDFEDLDTYLNSDEFNKAYNKSLYQPSGKSWAGRYDDYAGMTIEDFGR